MRHLARNLGVIFLCCLALLSANAAQAATAGTRDYDFTAHEMRFYDGTQWYNFSLGLPLGVCTNEGAMEFDPLLALYQYCNGTFWIKIVGLPTLTPCTQKGDVDYSAGTYMVCNGLVWTNIKGTPVVM